VPVAQRSPYRGAAEEAIIMPTDGCFRCPECGSVEVERRLKCQCGYVEPATTRAPAQNAQKKAPSLWLGLVLLALGIIGFINESLKGGVEQLMDGPRDQRLLLRWVLNVACLLLGIAVLARRILYRRSS
jgi:predicted RNA-binding Zn-ribbon protein involved in translation (DUF1610 family)